MVFSFLYWFYFAATSIVLFMGALALRVVTLPFDRPGVWLHLYTCWWSGLYLRCLPGCWIEIVGREKIEKHRAYVLVANHQSYTDIMALAMLMVPFKWVSKKEVFGFPVIGWNMHLNRYVQVDRANVRAAALAIGACRRWLASGMSVMIFPEGHRSRDGAIRRFEKGAFRLAVECNCPVVPIIVDGTLPIYRGFRVTPRPGTVRIHVLNPVTPEEVSGNASRMTEVVRERMITELAQLRSASPGSQAWRQQAVSSS